MKKICLFRYLCMLLCVVFLGTTLPGFATETDVALTISDPISLDIAEPAASTKIADTPKLQQDNKNVETEITNYTEATTTPGAEPNGEATTTPDVESNGKATTTPDVESNGKATTTPGAEPNGEATTTPDVESNGEATTTPGAEPNGEATTTPEVSVEPSVSVSTTPTNENQNRIIKSFNVLNPASCEMHVKPEMEAFIAEKLPDKLDVVFLIETVLEGEEPENGATTTVTAEEPGNVPVTWEYIGNDSYDERAEGEFVFRAKLPETGYELADASIKMPEFTLIVNLTIQFGDYQGVLNEKNELTITAWAGTEAELIVPETLGEAKYPVKAIASEVFAGKTGLKQVTFPMGVETVGDRLFANSADIEKVIIPDSLRSVGNDLFSGCASIKSIVLSTENGSTLKAADTFEYTITDENDVSKQKKITICISDEFTDVEVKAKTFILDCDFTIQKENAVTVDSGATMRISDGKTLKNFGELSNNGSVELEGTIITCTGIFRGNPCQNLDKGSYISNHNYENGICTGCGGENQEENPVPTSAPTITKLEIRYEGSTPSKVYDGTKNVTIKSSDFVIRGVAEGHEVRITAIKAAYDSPNVGNRTIKATLTLGGTHAAYYTCDPVSISASIKPRKLTITPNPNQTKRFGTADPSTYTGKVKGLLAGDMLTGRLSREAGENAGKYRILQGTIDGGNNYTIDIAEVYYIIEPKSINSTDVGMLTIGNQRYTGYAVTPAITLRYGEKTLEEGIDFTVSYSNNIQPGTASVRLCGIGNYSGERTATFRILKVSSGVDYTGGYTGPQISGTTGGLLSSGSFSSSGAFDAGYEEYDDESEVYGGEEGNLVLDGTDYGTILFNALNEPRPFSQIEEEIENQIDEYDAENPQWRLRILAEPAIHEYSGEVLYLDNDREMYEELHLRISVEIIEALKAQKCMEISFEVEDAELLIPLEQLTEKVFVEKENDADGDNSEETLEISLYDICIQQVQPDGLTERETVALQDYRQLTHPYRVRIVAENSLSDDQGNEIIYDYPVMDQIEDMRLCVMMADDFDQNASDCRMIWVSDDLQVDMYDSETVINRYESAEFFNDEDIVYAVTWLDASGLYLWGSVEEYQ